MGSPIGSGIISGNVSVNGVPQAGVQVQAVHHSIARYRPTKYTVTDALGNYTIQGLNATERYDVIAKATGKKARIIDNQLAVAASNPGDPFWEHVVAQTSFDRLDMDDFGHPLVVTGDITIVNDPERGNVMNCPAQSGHSIKYPIAADSKLLTRGNNWTLEFWQKCMQNTAGSPAYLNSFSMGGGLNYSWHSVALQFNPITNQLQWALRSDLADFNGSNPDIAFYWTATDPTTSASWYNRWQHIAVTRNRQNFYLHIGGKRIADVPTSWNMMMSFANNTGIAFGAPFWSDTGVPQDGMPCRIDDFRLTMQSRYGTADFTPPATLSSF